MRNAQFHSEAFDPGTLLKLKIFELYVQEWIPVFLSRPDPPFSEVHLFDFFCGPGTDSFGNKGSPLRILQQLARYRENGLAGWDKVRVVAHFSDLDPAKIDCLKQTIADQDLAVEGVELDIRPLDFNEALKLHRGVLSNQRAAKLLLIDQFGVDAVSDQVFAQLTSYPTSDFIFFLSSSTLHRFRDHPAIKIKIERPDDSYDVHRAAFDWYRNKAPVDWFLGKFSIRKGSNIYGLIFGSKHILGIQKFLSVAWKNDEIAGEANFDIDHLNAKPGELFLGLDEFRPKKIQGFEADLESAFRNGLINNEADLMRFVVEAGMAAKHCVDTIKKLKTEGTINCDFRSPNVRYFKNPRPIHYPESERGTA
jgi:three-Cys-motif partner protein